MTQEKVDIQIDANIAQMQATLAQAKKDIQFFSNNLKAAGTQASKVELAQTQVANTLNAIARMSDDGISRIFIAGAEGIKQIDLESLRQEAVSTIEAMNAAWDSQGQRIANTIDSIQQLNDRVTQPAARAAIDRFGESVTATKDRLAEVNAELQTAATRVESIPEMPAVAPALPAIAVVPSVAPAAVAAVAATSTFAAMATQGLAVAMNAAAVGALAVQRATRGVRNAVSEAATSFDLMRAAANAPIVDPAANFSKSDILERAALEADRIEKFRAQVDAQVSGYKDTAVAAMQAAEVTANANARAAASATKHEWANRQASGSINLLRTAFAPVGGMVKSVADQYGGLNPKLAETAANARKVATETRDAATEAARKAFVLTGALDQASATTQQYGHVIRAAGMGQRLMVREIEGGQRVISRTMNVVSAITTPLRSMRDASARNRDEWRQLRQLLGQPEPTGPGLIARSFIGTANASKTMAAAIAESSSKVGKAIAGTSVVRKEIEFQKRQFAELKEDFRPLYDPLARGTEAAKLKLTELGTELRGQFTAGVAQGRAALQRFGQLEPVQRAMQQATKAARAIGDGAAWAAPKLVTLGQGFLAGVSRVAKYTQSLKLGESIQSGIAKSMLFLHQRTRWLHPAFGMVTGAVGRMFARFRGAQPATQAVAQATDAVGNAATEAAPQMQQLATATGQVQQKMQQAAPAMQNAGKVMRQSVPSGSGGGFGSYLKGAIASKLALGAMAGAALAWGGATAIATETATVKFGTLLQDMDQGKALIGEITAFSAATPFSNEELRESAGLLLAAQVPADEITKRLQMLGDIASGTSQPIGDLSKVFQKVASTGKLGLGEINQLAERGVPIYSALQDTLGVSRSEMLKMVSDGKLGFADMDAALQSLTAAGGMFAGGMDTQSQTFAGLFSTLKDNVAIALESVVSILMPFAKRMLDVGISITQGFVAAFQRIRPVLQMWFEAAAALFQLLSNAASYAFEAIAGLAAMAFGGMGSNGGGILQGLMEGFMVFYATAKFAFENIGLTWQLISTGISLMAVQMFNGMVHWLTVALPGYMAWFGDNWKNLFTDMGTATLTIFENMFKNIKSIMNAIWAFIKSAGMSSIEVAWTPLLDGFIATTKKLPDIPTRQIGAMEAALMAESEALSTKFATGLESGIADAMKMLEPEKKIELKGGTGIDSTMPEEDEDGKKGKNRTSFVVDAMDKNSEAALKAMLGAKEDQTPKKQLDALQQIAKNTKPKPMPQLAVQGAVP